ncbi:glycosyltransferase family 2 protein [Mesomycoplasma moatsii]|uniref:glycosyltransferase family 2 protein n=1 Tax=Mesomycoplasma moatsii TaxID=171287 RepID=UPI0003B4373E
MNNIKLTIIIPSYNVGSFITKALESIKNQSIKNQYEVLIIDDGSKDDTGKIVKEWIEKNNLSNSFKYYLKTNGNWGSVINYVKDKKLVNGKYISILDADDYFLDNCFEKVFLHIDKNYDLIVSNFFRKRKNKLVNTKVMFSSKSKVLKKERSFSAWSIPLCKFFKYELFNQLENLKENVSYQDQILFNRFLIRSKSIYFIKKNLGVYYENREGSSTRAAWNENRINLWCENMNNLLALDSREVNAYVMMMIDYCYRNSSKELKHLVKIESKYIEKFKKAKFTWLYFGTRILAKFIFTISTRKIIKNSKQKK